MPFRAVRHAPYSSFSSFRLFDEKWRLAVQRYFCSKSIIAGQRYLGAVLQNVLLQANESHRVHSACCELHRIARKQACGKHSRAIAILST